MEFSNNQAKSPLAITHKECNGMQICPDFILALYLCSALEYIMAMTSSYLSYPYRYLSAFLLPFFSVCLSLLSHFGVRQTSESKDLSPPGQGGDIPILL